MPQCNEDLNTVRSEVTIASSVLKAMGNEYRLLALLAIAQKPMAVCELNVQLPLAQSALSQHLARLRSAGLVKTQRDGPKIRYSLADQRTRHLLAAVITEYAPSLAALLAPEDLPEAPPATASDQAAAQEFEVFLPLPRDSHEPN
ncbi:MAG TPA: hypothetical protein DCZ11_04705 [Gammaproteobacteria bacterium]|nr:hypothetical protein [Gammaproteobacteria bacterium]HCZ48288.1 hypothetical protein [Gammaproteobacteria bacterium]MCH77726.1 hypothetical protein [Gammaproteobacteria bacterium]